MKAIVAGNCTILIRVQSTGVIHIGKDDLGIWKGLIRVILAYPNQIREEIPEGCITRVRRSALKANKGLANQQPIGPAASLYISLTHFIIYVLELARLKH